MVIILVCIIYLVLTITLSILFSISLCGKCISSTSDIFECGFYSFITSSIKYVFNYWMIVFHFLIFEQEMIISLFILFSFNTISSMFTILLLLCSLLLGFLLDNGIIGFHLLIVLLYPIIYLVINVYLLFNDYFMFYSLLYNCTFIIYL